MVATTVGSGRAAQGAWQARAAARVLCLLLCCSLLCLRPRASVPLPSPGANAAAGTLPSGLSLDANSVTVSGLSAGGFMAHQIHVAHSDLVHGAGIVAGGPFGCAERMPNPWTFGTTSLPRVQAATLSCTHVAGSNLLGLPVPPPRAEDSLAVLVEAARVGAIAAPSHLVGARVWLFRGAADELVPAETSMPW